MNNKAGHFAGYHRDFRIDSKSIKAQSICTTTLPLLLLSLAVFCASNVKAAEIDWGQVDAKTIKTF